MDSPDRERRDHRPGLAVESSFLMIRPGPAALLAPREFDNPRKTNGDGSTKPWAYPDAPSTARSRLTTATVCGNISWERSDVETTSFSLWKGDHDPRHVHVFRDGKLILKWDLENEKVMRGHPTKRVLKLIRDLRAEGLL